MDIDITILKKWYLTMYCMVLEILAKVIKEEKDIQLKRKR